MFFFWKAPCAVHKSKYCISVTTANEVNSDLTCGCFTHWVEWCLSHYIQALPALQKQFSLICASLSLDTF